MDSVTYVLCCVIMPRFIMAIRELYNGDRSDSGWQGVDTGFSVYSEPGGNDDVSGIFQVRLGEGQNDSSGVIELEEVGKGVRLA